MYTIEQAFDNSIWLGLKKVPDMENKQGSFTQV